jgi:lipoate-protein ligase B
MGRGGTGDDILTDRATLACDGIAVHETDRGGAVTYHGPGQLVCYPILDLTRHGRDVHLHARRLEEVMLRTAAACGVVAWRRPGYPGVWTAQGKLGALGVAVRRWVTLHGFALNVCPDLDHFVHIVPCGLPGVPATSLACCLGRDVSLAAVRDVVRTACGDVFGLDLSDRTVAELDLSDLQSLGDGAEQRVA